jgi:hypothetical protein
MSPEPTITFGRLRTAMGRELPPRWWFVAGLGVVALTVVALVVSAVFPRKLSTTETARWLHHNTTYGSITCRREAGRFWRGWDYLCKGRAGRTCDVFDVEVNGSDVTNQDMPGDCKQVTRARVSRARAVEEAKAFVVRVDYGGDEPLFYRNTGDRPVVVRPTTEAGGHRSWFIRFDDSEAMRTHCVIVRRSSPRVITRGTAC